jgi:hypothetical protein
MSSGTLIFTHTMVTSDLDRLRDLRGIARIHGLATERLASLHRMA